MRDKIIDIVNGVLKDNFDYVPLDTSIKVADALIASGITKEVNDEKHLCVCERCLMAIESREGNLVTLSHYVDESDPEASRCDWCEESGFDTLYELI